VWYCGGTNQKNQKDQTNQNLYLAMVAEKAAKEADFDPIYTYESQSHSSLKL
jgi:hypothetical protein